MFADKGFVSHLGRAAMIAGVAAIVMTSAGPSVAAPAGKENGVTATTGTSGATDFSSRGRYYRGGGAAAAAAFAGIVGTGIAIAAANSRRDYYEPYGYGYGYGGPPVAYYGGPGYYYGGGYYGQRRQYGGYDTGMRPYGGW